MRAQNGVSPSIASDPLVLSSIDTSPHRCMKAMPPTLHRERGGGGGKRGKGRGRESESESERSVLFCQTASVCVAHATHFASSCTRCQPFVRDFFEWIRTPPSKIEKQREASAMSQSTTHRDIYRYEQRHVCTPPRLGNVLALPRFIEAPDSVQGYLAYTKTLNPSRTLLGP